MPFNPPDLTYRFNTPLTPPQERAFQAWLAKSGRALDLKDYDLRGAWKADAKAAANGHLPDQWKKPNHPTFSTESVYNGADGRVGGQWVDEGKDHWRFVASQANVSNMGADGLVDYFRRREPDSKLIMPDGFPAFVPRRAPEPVPQPLAAPAPADAPMP